MEAIKSTEELAVFLWAECERSVKIQSECSPLKGPGPENPEWEKILDFNYENSLKALEGYWDIREQVHQYQMKYGVSGVIWKEWIYQGKTIRCPQLHDQMIAIPGDKEVLLVSSEAVFMWWTEVTQGLELWKSLNDGDELATLSELMEIKKRSEWIETYISTSFGQWEVYVLFHWGELEQSSEGVAFYALTSETETAVLEKLLTF